jgi:egghead protein (zeste-white 4 protein)
MMASLAAATDVAAIGRDFRHRASVIILAAGTTAALYAVQRAAWPRQQLPHGALMLSWAWASLLWVTAALPAACELAGLLMYRHPRNLEDVRPVPYFVCFRIVSRGINKDALRETIYRTRAAMQRTPLFRYAIEVVIDTSPDGLPAPARDLRYLVVPAGYRTPNGSRYKARALEYASQVAPLADRAWLVHSDEETVPTRSGIQGIARMIAEEEESGNLRIGQGAITYHRNWRERPILTLADVIRTGDDLGRFYLAMRTGIPLFGLHGSFIVVRNDVEQRVGFDLGPAGSVTEDAWWGCMQMAAGSRCRWVDGYFEEQAVQKVSDFLKQRRRWFCGLVRTVVHAPARFRYRALIGACTLAWALTPLAWVYTVAHFALGGYIPPEVRALANASFAVYVAATVTGLRVNLDEHGVRHPVRRAGWYLLWPVLMPAFSAMEAASIGYAIFRPSVGFHIVAK